MSYVYFIRAKGTPYIKIGKANNTKTRLKELQTGCPYELKVVYKIKCKKEEEALHIEKELHNTYKHKHKLGEWYRINNKDIKTIKNKYKQYLYKKPNLIKQNKNKDKYIEQICINNNIDISELLKHCIN